MESFLSSLPSWVRSVVALLALPALLYGSLNATTQGWRNAPAAAKGLSDTAASFAKVVSDLIAADNSEAERVSTLRRKYLDDNIYTEAPRPSMLSFDTQQPGAPASKVSAFLPDTVSEYRRILAKANEINRICGAPTDPNYHNHSATRQPPRRKELGFGMRLSNHGRGLWHEPLGKFWHNDTSRIF